MKKIIRITTVPQSLWGLLEGQLKFMSEHYEVLGVSNEDEHGNLKNGGERDGIRVLPVDMTRKITPVKDLFATWHLYRIFRKEKPFIVHTHTPKAGTLGMLAARLARVPHRLHTVAGLPLVEVKGAKRRMLNLVEKITYRCATKIFPNSFGLAQIILDHGFTGQKKIAIIGNGSSNGIDTTYFSPKMVTDEKKENYRKNLGIGPTDFTFVFVGRVVGDKGINELVAAFIKLSAEIENVKLIVVGPYEKDFDPVKPRTKEHIDTHKNILGVGHQFDVRTFLAISQALAFPSYREGFPNVVMQACAMELPCIVSDINGCNEIIEDGVNGYIVQTKSVDSLHASMKRMVLMERSEIRQMGEKARELIVSKYERHFVWDQILNEYRNLEAETDV